MNVLLLIFDDLAPWVLGCSGHRLARTPHIDALAARGVRFSQAFTPCAICAPGRACIFTGLRPDTHGVTTLNQPLRGRLPEVITWPQALRQRGWGTMRSGKIYHKGVPDNICLPSPGDDDPQSWCRAVDPAAMELSANGVMRNCTPWESHRAGIGGGVSWLRAERADRIHHDWQVATDLVDEIRRHDGTRPALWAGGFIRPHVPLVAPVRYFEAYDDLTMPLGGPERADATPLPAHIRGRWCGDFRLSDADRQGALRAYQACVAFVDDQIGRILDQLRTSGLEKDTLVILTGDHGFQLGEHGLWFKNFLYRESVHIPLIIADPRRPKTHGRTCNAFVEQPDLLPTIFDLLEMVPPPQAQEGVSLRPLLDDPDGSLRRGVLAQVDWQGVEGRSLRTDRYLYVEWSGAAESPRQLFDLLEDPGESVDLLHGKRDHPAVPALAEALHGGWRGLLTSPTA